MVQETTLASVSQKGERELEEERKSSTLARPLQAQKVIQVATIISFGKLGFWALLSQRDGAGQREWSYCCQAQMRDWFGSNILASQIDEEGSDDAEGKALNIFDSPRLRPGAPPGLLRHKQNKVQFVKVYIIV